MRRTESPTDERFDCLAILQHRMELPVADDIKGIIVSQRSKHALEIDAQVADELSGLLTQGLGLLGD
ncbi:MAG: hypothetical protein ACK55Z_31610 [bacterium]